METIYEFIQQKPQYFAWIFTAVNAFWGIFLYFNGQRHERELEQLINSLSIESERRKRVFELKTNQYEAYITLLDGLGRNHHAALSEKFAPIVQEFLSNSLDDEETPEQSRKKLEKFSSSVLQLSQEGVQDLMHVKHESSRLKLTATDEMLIIFEKLEVLIQSSIDKFHELMSNFVSLLVQGDNEEMNSRQQSLTETGTEIEKYRDRLITCMRAELQNI